jgi:hypothetical protein
VITYEINGGALNIYGLDNDGNGYWDAPQLVSDSYYVFKSWYLNGTQWEMLAWTSVTTQALPSNQFGFNYWPRPYSSEALYDSNWPTAKVKIQADLDQISSLGGRVVRLMFWPGWSGYNLTGQTGMGGVITPQYTQLTNNLVEFLGYVSARRMKAVICFANSYIEYEPDPLNPTYRLWMSSYSNLTQFVSDTLAWMNGIVNAAESSSYKNSVIYYDYQNELSDADPNIWQYLRQVYDGTSVPMGKRGASVLWVNGAYGNDVPLLASNLQGRRLDYVEFHSYPEQNLNPVPSSYAYTKSYFADSTVLLGEFGHSTHPPATEATQATSVANIRSQVQSSDIPYYFNWTLWDATPIPGNEFGWGYDEHQPKEVMARMAEQLNLIYNADMELLDTHTPAKPLFWGAGGTVPVTFSAAGPSSATGSWYARLHMPNDASGQVWLLSPFAPVKGGTQLFVNSHIRSTLANVAMLVLEYDTSLNVIGFQVGPVYTPATWAMENYLHKAGTWAPRLNPATAGVQVGIIGDVLYPDRYLDVDLVTASQHN